jgi:hypothetical protein
VQVPYPLIYLKISSTSPIQIKTKSHFIKKAHNNSLANPCTTISSKLGCRSGGTSYAESIQCFLSAARKLISGKRTPAEVVSNYITCVVPYRAIREETPIQCRLRKQYLFSESAALLMCCHPSTSTVFRLLTSRYFNSNKRGSQ